EGLTACDSDPKEEVGTEEPVLGRCGVPNRTTEFSGVLSVVHTLACFHTRLDLLGEFALFGGVQQRHRSDFVQVLAYRITHGNSFNTGTAQGIPDYSDLTDVSNVLVSGYGATVFEPYLIPERPVTSVTEYTAIGGGHGLAKALEVGPAATIEEILAAGLRGRGG